MSRLTSCLAVLVALLGVRETWAVTIQWKFEDGGNGHYYEYVAGNREWTEAKAAAEASAFAGVFGHLATITSEPEKEFLRRAGCVVPLAGPKGCGLATTHPQDVVGASLTTQPAPLRTQVPQPRWRAWLGGSQDRDAPDYSEPSGGWRWITGEPWDYTHWANPEPNNFFPDEDFLEVDIAAASPDHFGWSDQSDFESTNSGYYVEYPIPEPSTLALLAMGVVGLVAHALRRG